jgi:hypothetical protein
MTRNYESMVLIGFVLVFVGILILVSSSTGNSGGFFFFFPFFFIGDVGSFGPALIGLSVLFGVVILAELVLFLRPMHKKTIRCHICQYEVYQGFRYCPNCGAELDPINSMNYE